MNSQLTKCKACGAEIAKGVKKCPHCGADQRNIFMKHKIISAIVILIIIGSIGSIGSNPSNGGQTGTTTEKAATNQSKPAVATQQNKVQEKPKYEILSHQITTDDSGIRYVSGQIKNNSGRTASYAQVEVNLYDSNGNQLGSTLDNLNNLEDGKIWNFKAVIDKDNVASYKIIKVSGF